MQQTIKSVHQWLINSSEGQKRLKAKVQHQWLKTQAKHPTPKTKQKKTAPFGAVLMQ
jgi:hypothetical protein